MNLRVRRVTEVSESAILTIYPVVDDTAKDRSRNEDVLRVSSRGLECFDGG